jgi:hypothetical protein
MGSIRNLKKDPKKIKKVHSHTLDLKNTTTHTQPASYTSTSAVTITFGNDFGGYYFNVVSTSITSRPQYISISSYKPQRVPCGYSDMTIHIEEPIGPATSDMWSWASSVTNSTSYKKDGILEIRNYNNSTTQTWDLFGCFPIKMEMSGSLFVAEISCDKWTVR